MSAGQQARRLAEYAGSLSSVFRCLPRLKRLPPLRDRDSFVRQGLGENNPERGGTRFWRARHRAKNVKPDFLSGVVEHMAHRPGGERSSRCARGTRINPHAFGDIRVAELKQHSFRLSGICQASQDVAEHLSHQR